MHSQAEAFTINWTEILVKPATFNSLKHFQPVRSAKKKKETKNKYQQINNANHNTTHAIHAGSR